ncbi:hypothetical protein QFC22_002022 [Naganishia vaughanmartiniae]|uniref:Uncharacterized protein n=1 Tax=Naganishia vaughanmartiniae TaxID=1424756 RepID=A0ACC2XFJ3_9TREE|nr:hypothetical protein QFC22_002022 [Naganishia vaughanmartiniae]
MSRGSLKLPGTYPFGNAGLDDDNDDLEDANELRGRRRPDYTSRTVDTRTIQRALLRNGRYYQRSRSWSPLQYISLPSDAQHRIVAQEPLVTPFVPAARVAAVNSDARSAPSHNSIRYAPPRNVADQVPRCDATRTPTVVNDAVKKSNETRQGQTVTKGPAVPVASCSVSSAVNPSRPAATAVKPVLIVCPKCSVKSESQSTVGTSNLTNAIDTIKKPTSTKPVIKSQTATQHQVSSDIAVKPVATAGPAALASDVHKAVAPARVTAERTKFSPRAAHQSPVSNAQNKAPAAVPRAPKREITNETRTPLNTPRRAEVVTAAKRVDAFDQERPRAPTTPATERVVRFEEPVVKHTVDRACENQAAPPAIASHAEADVVDLCQARPVEAQERKVQSLSKKPRARPVARSSANLPKSTGRQAARTRVAVSAAANSVTRVTTGRHVSNRSRKAKEHLGPDRPLRAERPAPYVHPTVNQMPSGLRELMSSSVDMGTQATPAGNTTRWPVPVTPTPATRVPQHGHLKAYSLEVRKSLVKVMAIAKEPPKISLASRIGVRLSTGAIPLVMTKIERVNVFGSHQPAYSNTAHVWIPSGGLGGASTAVTSQMEPMEAVMEVDYWKRTVDQLEISAEEVEACGRTGSMGMVENGLFASGSPRSTMTVGIDAERLEDAGMAVDDNVGLPSFDFGAIKLSDSDEQVKRKRYEELWACRG